MASQRSNLLAIAKAAGQRLVWDLGAVLSGRRRRPGRYWCRVLGGPIRGARISMPHRERLSFVLGIYEAHVVAAMRDHVRPGMTAYDVGAHIGYLTLVLARLVGPSGRVVAIEADPRNRSILEENLAANGVANVTVVPVVVADSVGTAHFATFSSYSSVGHIADAGTPEDADVLRVPSTTLDEMAYGGTYPAPSFVKIDVEGAEVRVFQGALRTLGEARPIIIAEARAGTTLEPLLQIAQQHDYAAQILQSESGLAAQGVIDVLFTSGHSAAPSPDLGS